MWSTVLVALGGCKAPVDPRGAPCAQPQPAPATAPVVLTGDAESCHPPDAAPPGAAAWLFEIGDALLRFEITVTPEDHDQLVRRGLAIECEARDDPDEVCEEVPEYTPGHVRMVDGRGAVRAELASVGLELKGKPGSSFQPVTVKPYLKIDFDVFEPGRTLDGLHSLRLYNQWEDVSQVARYLGYRIWRGDHDPAPLREGSYPAQRAGYATVQYRVGDAAPVELGLYGISEEMNEDFLAQWPDALGRVTQLYEGEYGQDLRSDTAHELELECGADDDHAMLDAVVASIEDGTLAKLDRLAEYWALETAVGAREGYANQINNYYVAIRDDGVAMLLATGFDQVLHDELPIARTDARLTAHPELGEEYRRALRCQVEQAIDWGGLQAELDRLLSFVKVPATDPTLSGAYHDTEIGAAQRDLDWYLERAPAHILLDLDEGY